MFASHFQNQKGTMEQQSSFSIMEQKFAPLSLPTTWLEEFRETLSKNSCYPNPEYVLRAASPASSGTNSRSGIKAGKYANCAMNEIPSLEDIVIGTTPGTGTLAPKTYSPQMKALENETLSHFNKNQRRMRTDWISTTSSLLRALQILFIEHREKGRLYVIRTASCKDNFTAIELRDCLPGLKKSQYMGLKSPNEFLVWGKVEGHAIVGCASVEALLEGHYYLDVIVPRLSSLRGWQQKNQWLSEIISLRLSHCEVSDVLLDAAVALAFMFGMEDKAAMVREFLGVDFRICSVGLDEDRVLDGIKKRSKSALDKAMRDFHQAVKELILALKELTQALEQNI